VGLDEETVSVMKVSNAIDRDAPGGPADVNEQTVELTGHDREEADW
jgi:hypothetical protein